jgi:hypothetical protein
MFVNSISRGVEIRLCLNTTTAFPVGLQKRIRLERSLAQDLQNQGILKAARIRAEVIQRPD